LRPFYGFFFPSPLGLSFQFFTLPLFDGCFHSTTVNSFSLTSAPFLLSGWRPFSPRYDLLSSPLPILFPIQISENTSRPSLPRNVSRFCYYFLLCLAPLSILPPPFLSRVSFFFSSGKRPLVPPPDGLNTPPSFSSFLKSPPVGRLNNFFRAARPPLSFFAGLFLDLLKKSPHFRPCLWLNPAFFVVSLFVKLFPSLIPAIFLFPSPLFPVFFYDCPYSPLTGDLADVFWSPNPHVRFLGAFPRQRL